jgi:hypothetical protein
LQKVIWCDAGIDRHCLCLDVVASTENTERASSFTADFITDEMSPFDGFDFGACIVHHQGR